MPIERKLAAIMFTDIAGYTEQMSQDEDKAFAPDSEEARASPPLIEKHDGKLIKEIGDKRGMGYSLNSIGIVHHYKGEYNKAVEHLEKSLAIQKEIGFKGLELYSTIYLYLSYKQLGKDYDVNEIYSLIKETDNIGFEVNFRFYELLEESSYLETAYNQVQDKASEMEEEFKTKFLSYPISKQIIKEYKNLNKDKN